MMSKEVKLFIDENIECAVFLRSSADKYLSPFFKKNKNFYEFISEIRFLKMDNEISEKYMVSYKDNIVSMYGNEKTLICALFDFLEKLGWRFFTPKLECLLQKKCSLNFQKPFSYSYEPQFEYRQNLWDGLSEEWQIKNGMNALYAKEIPKHLGGSKNYAGNPVHTFNRLIPPSEYYENHPNLFALNANGERIKNQLCLSNEETFIIALEKVKDWLRKNPTAHYISISQNDCNGDCLCEGCKQIKKDGNPSDLMIFFVNKFADALKDEYPNLKVQTLAYMYTVEPPKYFIPKNNVNVMLCPIQSCENHEATDMNCRANKNFVRQLQGWRKITDNIYLWKYYNDFSYLIAPFQCLNNQSKNFNYYAKNGVKGFFAEGSHSGETSDFCELKAYMFAKLIYNPTMSKKKFDELIKEFCLQYYGEKSGRQILQYLRLLTEVAKNSHYDCYPAPYTVIPTNPKVEKNDKYFIKKAKSLFAIALKNAENQTKRKRIEKEYISVLYFSLYTNFENDMLNANKEKRKRILEEQALLFALIDKYKIKNVRNHISGILVKKYSRRTL